GSYLYTRFDFWPALFVTAGLAALLRDRHSIGWLALAIAVCVKLFALVLLPLAAVWTLRRRGRPVLGRSLAILGAVVAVTYLPFLVVAPHGTWESIWEQASRPLQIESLLGAAVRTFGSPLVIGSHGSLNVAGHGTLATLTSLVEIATLLAIWVAFARGPADPQRFVR